jgi:hypothetical protein
VTTPRGKLSDVPLAVRRLCSLLYRATRRQAVAVDRLTVAVDALADGMDELRDQILAQEAGVDELAARVGRLEERAGP